MIIVYWHCVYNFKNDDENGDDINHWRDHNYTYVVMFVGFSSDYNNDYLK